MILAGDIGGTKTVLALYPEVSGRLAPIHEEIFVSQAFVRFDQILTRFLEGLGSRTPCHEPIDTLCLGVAGPVYDGQTRTTNLPWVVDEQHLAQTFGIPHVHLLNDLEAAAYGMLFLSDRDWVTLHPGTGRGNIAVIAAGTGLGEALLYWNGQNYEPIASEGGHADFAPRNDREMELMRFLRREYDHVSYERVISGPGIFNLYRFLRDTGFAQESNDLNKALTQGDVSATITKRGMAGEDPLCVETLAWFASLYGAEAGNLALKVFALGGVYIGGGIAPKILGATGLKSPLQDGTFMKGFIEKGRYSDLMRKIPVRVCKNSRAPLIGAAHYALRMGQTRSS